MKSFALLWRFVKPYRRYLLLGIAVGLIRNAIPMLMPLFLMYTVDDVIGSGLAEEQRAAILFAAVGTAAAIFLVLRVPVEFGSHYLSEWIGNRMLFDIRAQLYDHLQHLSMRFFHRRKSGELVSRVIYDVEQTKHFVTTGLINFWLDLIVIAGTLSLMLSIHVPLTFVALVALPVYAFAMKFFFGKFRTLTKQRSQALAEVNAHLSERVQGIAVIKSFALEGYERERFNERNGFFLKHALVQLRWNALTQTVVNTVTDLAPLLIIGYGGYLAISGELSTGAFMAFFAYVERLYAPLRRLIQSATHFTQSIASMDRVTELLEEPRDMTERADAIDADRLTGHIRFDCVTFRYEKDREPVLSEVDLTIAPGETVAFVGMSGGGKSSLTSLIPRLYDVSEGSVMLDGVNVRDYKLDSLRRQVGSVLQDTYLFSGTIRDNIRIGRPDATDEEITAAAANAAADGFIRGLPGGYDMLVGERGVVLSGGQKQRIAIARLFLKNPPIFVLDEATSALDLESEQAVRESLRAFARGRTTIIVAHRLSTVVDADRIYVIEHGRIAEFGTHSKLMERDGIYKRLYQIQAAEERQADQTGDIRSGGNQRGVKEWA